MNRKTFAFAAVAALALSAATVQAATSATLAPVVVQTADLDLTTALDRAILSQRIDTAAYRFCATRKTVGYEKSPQFQNACYRAVREEIRSKL